MRVSRRELAEGILFTDQYQLTMAQLYFRLGLHEKQAQFDHFFRATPITARTKPATASTPGWSGCSIGWQRSRFREEDIDYLRGQREPDRGSALFDEDFLAWLRRNGDFAGISPARHPRRAGWCTPTCR